MNNNSTLFYEYTLNGKIEINDMSDMSFNFELYNDVFNKLNKFSPVISDDIVRLIIEMAEK